jgi:hypothetical protein
MEVAHRAICSRTGCGNNRRSRKTAHNRLTSAQSWFLRSEEAARCCLPAARPPRKCNVGLLFIFFSTFFEGESSYCKVTAYTPSTPLNNSVVLPLKAPLFLVFVLLLLLFSQNTGECLLLHRFFFFLLLLVCRCSLLVRYVFVSTFPFCFVCKGAVTTDTNSGHRRFVLLEE